LSFRLDGVFLPKDEKSDRPINFVEVQFQRDDDIYYRFITESFLYLGQTKPGREWQARLIFASKALDPGIPKEYEFLLENGRLQIIYLRQMPKGDSPLLGIDVLRLVIATQKKALPQAQRLIERAEQEIGDPTDLKDIVGLILSDLRKTRYYQEVEADLRDEITTQVTDAVTAKVKLAPVSRLVSLGLSIQQIAQALEVDEALIRSTLESAHSQS
jgi:predicted transposase YdaD